MSEILSQMRLAMKAPVDQMSTFATSPLINVPALAIRHVRMLAVYETRHEHRSYKLQDQYSCFRREFQAGANKR